MAKHTENDFVIPALNVLYDLGSATTSEIKEAIPKYIELNNEDLMYFESRRTRKEFAYRQVVGNIISHHNNLFFKYAIKNEAGSGKPAGSFSLNDDGIAYISSLRRNEMSEVAIIEKIPDNRNDDKQKISGIDTKYMDYIVNNGFGKRPPTNSSITKTIIEFSNGECLYAKLIGEKHFSFKQDNGKNYVEAHHLIPLSARRDFFPRNLDRPSNIVCLCPTCHDILHHGTQSDKERILRVLYDHCIEALNEDQIYITFEQLLSYYS